MRNKVITAAVVVAALSLATIAGVSVTHVSPAPAPVHHTHAASHSATAPDWTVAPCSAWDDTQYPVLPAYTRTDVCAADDGALSYAPSN